MSGRDPLEGAAGGQRPTLGFRTAAGSHVGMVRSNNQDSGYAGRNLLLVADGMGGHAGGDVASATTVLHLVSIDGSDYGEHTQTVLVDEIQNANGALSGIVRSHPEFSGMGTTVTAALLTGSRLELAHIGDSRAYRLRDDHFEQVTKDHTFVQRLVDEGRIRPEDAETHPKRSVIMRVLGDVDASPELDLATFDLAPGERWLFCSDGLSGVVHRNVIENILRSERDIDTCVERLIELTLRDGAPDNVTVVIGEVVASADSAHPPLLVGSATELDRLPVVAASDQAAAAQARLEQLSEPPREGPAEQGEEDITVSGAPGRRRRAWAPLAVLLSVAVVVAGAILGLRAWGQTLFYVGAQDSKVAIFQGFSQKLGHLELSSVYRSTQVKVSELNPYTQQRVANTIPADSLEDAERIVLELSSKDLRDTTDCPAPTPGASPTGKAGTPSCRPTTKAGKTPTPTPSTSSRPATEPSPAPAAPLPDAEPAPEPAADTEGAP